MPFEDEDYCVTVTVGSDSFLAYDLGTKKRKSLTGREIVWRLVIDAADYDAASAQMLGVFGAVHPEDALCRCREFNEIQTVGPLTMGGDGIGVWNLVVVDLVFSFLGFSPIYGGSATMQFTTMYDALPVDTPAFKFSGGNPLPLGAMPGRRVNSATIEIDLYYFTDDPATLMLTYGGRCNSGAIWGFPEGTIKFDGCSTRQNLRPDGTPTLNWIGQFSYREVGWNYLYNPNSGDYEAVESTTGGDPPFPEIDLTGMFSSGIVPILTAV